MQEWGLTTTTTDIDKLGESPDMLAVRKQVEDQLAALPSGNGLSLTRLSEAINAWPTVEPEYLDRLRAEAQVYEQPEEDDGKWPEDADPKLLSILGEFTGWLDPDGEHLVWRKGKQIPLVEHANGTSFPQEVIWQRAYGVIPEGRRVERSCEKNRCFRPDHFKLVLRPGVSRNDVAPVGIVPVLTSEQRAYNVEVMIMQPQRVTQAITAVSFEAALAQARKLPGIIKILGITEKESS